MPLLRNLVYDAWDEPLHVEFGDGGSTDWSCDAWSGDLRQPTHDGNTVGR